jgi:hypothetical protein
MPPLSTPQDSTALAMQVTGGRRVDYGRCTGSLTCSRSDQLPYRRGRQIDSYRIERARPPRTRRKRRFTHTRIRGRRTSRETSASCCTRTTAGSSSFRAPGPRGGRAAAEGLASGTPVHQAPRKAWDSVADEPAMYREASADVTPQSRQPAARRPALATPRASDPLPVAPSFARKAGMSTAPESCASMLGMPSPACWIGTLSKHKSLSAGSLGALADVPADRCSATGTTLQRTL